MPKAVKLVPPLILLLVVAAVSGRSASFHLAFPCLLLTALFCLTAFPLSRLMFASDTVNAWIFALPIGLVLHSAALAAVGAVFGIRTAPFLIYMALSTALAVWFQFRSPKPAGQTGWTGKDLLLLFLWAAAFLAAVALPFSHVGMTTAKGIAYRAYFNADFFRNLGVAGSLSGTGIPPDNPYFSGVVLHYHWFFQVLPVFFQQLFPALRQDLLFVGYSGLVVLMFAGALSATLRSFVSSRLALGLMLPVFLLGQGYDAVLVLLRLRHLGWSWEGFRVFNVDGIGRWLWHTPQVDSLLRAMLYAPQHVAVLCVLLLVVAGWKRSAGLGQRVLIFLLLFACVGFSTFLAGVAILVAGAALVFEALYSGDRSSRIRLALFFVLGACCFVLYRQSGFFAPESARVLFGPDMNILARPHLYFLLEWGAVGILGLLGLWRHTKGTPILLCVSVLALSLPVTFFMRLDLEDLSVFSIKFGYLAHLALFFLAAGWLDYCVTTGRRRRASALVILLLVPASLTPAMDLYNAADVTEKTFTSTLDADEMTAFQWIRDNLPARAVIQNDIGQADSYLSGFISEIPPFTGRSVYLSDPILSSLFQTPAREIKRREAVVCRLFRSDAPEEIHGLALEEDIRYLLAAAPDSSVYQHLAPPWFKRIFASGRMHLFEVDFERPVEAARTDAQVLLRDHGAPVLDLRTAANFYPPEPHEKCEEIVWTSNHGILEFTAARDIAGTFVFDAFARGKRRTLVIVQNDRELMRLPVKARGTTVTLPLSFKAGKTRIRLVCPEGPEQANRREGGADTRMRSFGMFRPRFESE